jgi:peptidoglycan/LPS O-acetylase OafA/YrhL
VLSALGVFAIFACPDFGLPRPAVEFVLVVLAAPTLVYFGANASISGLLAKAGAAIGLVSYGVYILQAPLIEYFYAATKRLLPAGQELPGAAAVILVAILTGLVSTALTMVYDGPARRWLLKRLGEPKRSTRDAR